MPPLPVRGDAQENYKIFPELSYFWVYRYPIFSVNASNSGNPLMRTTEQAFGEKLHTYTIVDAINDGKVLPFRIDYINTMRMAENVSDEQVYAIDVERALAAPERIQEVVAYILDHFNQKTMTQTPFTHWRGSASQGSILFLPSPASPWR